MWSAKAASTCKNLIMVYSIFVICLHYIDSKLMESLLWYCSTTVFSHSQTVVVCGNCQTVLCQPTGGKARLTEGCSFRKKWDSFEAWSNYQITRRPVSFLFYDIMNLMVICFKKQLSWEFRGRNLCWCLDFMVITILKVLCLRLPLFHNETN